MASVSVLLGFVICIVGSWTGGCSSMNVLDALILLYQSVVA